MITQLWPFEAMCYGVSLPRANVAYEGETRGP